MKIKVCGLRDHQNILDVLILNPDFIGFIFYKKSKRYVGDVFDTQIFKSFKGNTKFVGVFVDEKIEEVKSKVISFQLDYVQLHGNETSEYCMEASRFAKVIKVFSIKPETNFETFKSYVPFCNYFLFDTYTEEYGGSGKTFDWQILNNYPFETPFLLSGGIGLEEIKSIHKLKVKPFAVDVNSKFETEPGIKNINLFKQIKCIK